MNQFFRLSLPLLAAGSLFYATACASLPKEEMDGARAAIAEARAAQAEKFAPGELAEAQQYMNESDRMAKEEEYKDARAQALSAQEAARRAVQAAEQNRKIFEENERRRLEEEAKRKAEEEAALAAAEEEVFGSEEDAGEGDDFGEDFGEDEFAEAAPAEAAAGGEAQAAATTEEATAVAAAPAAEDIPMEEEAAPEFSAPAPAAAAPPPPPAPAARPAPPPPGPAYSGGETRPYQVRRYDTLAKIASRRDVYGEADLWPIIYEANKDAIRDPDRLPRTEIQIPVNPSETEK
ncbi:MAG: DUF4398 domain-containing protein, partial [Bdellovibrionota bacterium]